VSYAYVLSLAIEQAKKTHVKIVELCQKKYKCEFNASYLSKLKTGKETNPRDEVSIAIANVCGIDPDILIYERYIGNAPEFLQQFIRNTLEAARTVYMADRAKDETSVEAANGIKGFTSDATIIKHYNRLFPDMTYAEHYLTPHGKSCIIEDDSMVPRIPQDSVVYFGPLEGSIQNGDLVVAQYADKSVIVRTFANASGISILVPENRVHSALSLEKEGLSLIGRVYAIRMPNSEAQDKGSPKA